MRKPLPTHLLREEDTFGTRTFHGTSDEMGKKEDELRALPSRERYPARYFLGDVTWVEHK